ncbi:NAD(P)/FAD-dependent oxidoreductase [Sphingomonas sp. HF-S4]|uniref:NAD(P)/FAD-dependent oxidoreductase n=1 Tax=Sphingomonas agrestis TaxID=3080540 RepID=A0ABU3Y5F0_9SPHN|nr:NAD(P)/FAD-dependent oxidoreductase [Sphingomonas sp. HF-S4]MDV3456579.1 NAD(P)/FAD-dependent oxidoreductase [Sphingomonas sp. HF-S4]
MSEHFDVVVVGAGISGISAAWHLQANSPERSYVILEGRNRLGGTWDLFRYPGIRSDSDMYTLGFAFKPWTDAKAIADGPSILAYLDETVREHGIDRHIRTSHRVVRADWSSDDARWRVVVERGGEEVLFTCSFLFLCSGYYNYAQGYTPDFPGAGDFNGRIVHPQFWTDDVEYAGKNVVVIGSGATAVTLVPELANRAASVTMLQRSPTYIVARPSQDVVANWLRRRLPAKAAYGLTRWKNVLLQQYFFRAMRKHPDKAKRTLVDMVRQELPGHDVDTHFTPRYNPWDQRLCLIPDADLFASIREGKAKVVTDTIERFTETGIRLVSGRDLPADLIVTATGLEIQLMGGVPITIDGKPFVPAEHMTYKGMMFSDVPNFAIAFGYTNASWTLKADLTANYVTRLLNAMKKRGMRQVTPRLEAPVEEAPFLDFTSGYVQRAAAQLPRQGSRKPWKLHQNYTLDVMALKFGGIDQEMEFSNPAPANAAAA